MRIIRRVIETILRRQINNSVTREVELRVKKDKIHKTILTEIGDKNLSKKEIEKMVLEKNKLWEKIRREIKIQCKLERKLRRVTEM